MKIAVLTRRAGFNMGSTLQAYAMFKMLNKLGHDVKILNYDEYACFFMWRVKPFVFKTLKRIPLIPRISFIKKRFPLERIFAQQAKFEQFEARYFPLTEKKYRNSQELKETLGSYDAYVCGSDQIWSPMMFDPTFFLDFATGQPGIKTVAYAPSLGVTSVESLSKDAVALIKRISHISCREKEGANVLSEIVGHPVPTVLDPTLMLSKEDWDAVKSRESLTNKKDYILTYFLHTRSYKDNIPHHFINMLKKQTGLDVVNIQMYNMEEIIAADEQIYNAGPADFITLISKSKYVVTNSFHCCVFSSIFSKRFFVFEKYRKNSDVDNQNPRLYNLLEAVNRKEALIKDENAPIDLSFYPAKDKRMESFTEKRDISMEFIKHSLL